MRAENFEMLKLVLQIFLIALTAFVIPTAKQWITQNTTEKQRKEALYWGNLGIKLAEQIYKEKGKGLLKKEFVLEWLNKNGIKISIEQANILIDSIVDFYNAQGWDKVLEEV